MAKIRVRPKTHKPDEANPAFIMARLVMLDSVAFWALKPIEVRILAVIEIEHMRHGGVENGNLIVTRRQLEKRGIWKMAIAPGLRALAALGFIEIMERGAAGVGDNAQAHRFRLTYVQPDPTDEWRKHYDATRANAEAEAARANADVRARQLGLRGAQKQNAGPGNETGKVPETRPGPIQTEVKMASIGLENETGTGLENETTIYILGDRGRVPNAEQESSAPTAPTTPPDALHALVAKLPWSPPRWVEITPEIDQKLNRLIDNPTAYRTAPIDALTALEGLTLSNAVPDGSASPPKLVWKKPVVREQFGEEKRKRLEEFAGARHLSTISASTGGLQ